MDHQTRNQFEHYCTLAKIGEDAEKFLEINRILNEKKVRLNGQRPANSVRLPSAPSNVA